MLGAHFFGIVREQHGLCDKNMNENGRKMRLAKHLVGAFAWGLVAVLCSCGFLEGKMNGLADESAQKFNSMAGAAKTKQDAAACLEYYKRMEMDFLKFKVKDGFDEPLSHFYAGTSNSLAKIQADFNAHPEYGGLEQFMKKLGE